MEKQNVTPGAERPLPVKAIWIDSDGTPEPYLHYLDGDCDCPSCESKIRRIIVQ
jgi:hypothetical protein